MKKNVIVSLADANYYPLLDELVDSIKQFKESENVAICILDAGLEDKQKEENPCSRREHPIMYPLPHRVITPLQ